MKNLTGAVADVTAAPSADEHETLLKYEAILQNASVGIAFTKDRAFQHANRAFEELFGWGPGELAGQPGRVVWPSDAEYAEVGAAVGPRLAQGEAVELERRMSHRSGTSFWCRLQARPVDPRAPALGGTIWIIEDVTERRQAVESLRELNEQLEQRVRERTQALEQANERLKHEVEDRQQAEARAQHIALHDVLTGLPNRRLLNDRLVQSLAQAKREGWQLAVMFIDLDRFKNINDTLGHAVGDEVLREMARRLSTILRDSDTVARVGGDEFVVVLSHAQPGDLVTITTKMMSELSMPVTSDGQELRVTPSIGVASFPADADDPLRLLSQADAAMYHAKSKGRRNVQFYASSMSHARQERLKLENDLHHALARKQLELYYQPRIDLRSGAVASFEALIRWHHPEHGTVEPGVFIPIAEDSGLIMPIGDWVIDEACRQLTRWHEAGMPFASVSVNISARQFFDTRLPDRVRRALEAATLDGSQLELEITESVLMAHTTETQSVFAGLKDLGVKLSIDDFGTGFSSLAYLKRFQVDNLKIDHSFVRDIGTDADDAAIVQAIVGLARSLQLRVIAEGVETREQLAFLADCGCDEAQGYLFARPLPVAEAQRIGPLDLGIV
ncbi:MAG: EAL domain-containing protein [Betaproteobacteria bacterium]|nr:EAL domain-containing protein [Betaproteobacteria bacterium]